MHRSAALTGHFKAAWKLAVRSRSFQAVLFLAVLLLLIAYLGAAFSARQPKIVALDLGLSGLRVGLLLLAFFWLHELLSKEIDRRSILLYLSFPVRRSTFLLARWAAVLVALFAVGLVLAVVLRVGVSFASWGYEDGSVPQLNAGFWLIVLLVWVEVAVVSAFTLAVSTISSTLFFPMVSGFLFALAGRMVGPVFDYLLGGADGDQELRAHFLPAVEKVRWLLPDFSALDQRPWALYGATPDFTALTHAVAANVAYCALWLMLAVALFDRRKFA